MQLYEKFILSGKLDFMRNKNNNLYFKIQNYLFINKHKIFVVERTVVINIQSQTKVFQYIMI